MFSPLAWLILTGAARSQTIRTVPAAELRDRIAGGWAGQMIEVSFGAPTEFRSNGKINESVLPPSTPDRVSNALEQDDLYVDITFAKVLDGKGLGATIEDFGAMFTDAKYPYGMPILPPAAIIGAVFRRLYPLPPKYNVHANDIGFQSRAISLG